jgi:hypothetical protein
MQLLLAHLSLRQIDRNDPALEVRKWDILNAMCSVAMSWEANMSVVIQNCFAKFRTLSEVSNKEAEENDEWVQFQGCMDGRNTFPSSEPISQRYVNGFVSIILFSRTLRNNKLRSMFNNYEVLFSGLHFM